MSKSPKPKSLKARKVARGPKKHNKGVPPKKYRYPKGVSGNPQGRPKGSKNLSTILMEAAKAPVMATIDGKPRKINKLVATAMQLATQAASGEPRAMGKFLDLIDEVEARAAANRPAQFPFTPGDIEVLQEVYERMKLSQPLGGNKP